MLVYFFLLFINFLWFAIILYLFIGLLTEEAAYDANLFNDSAILTEDRLQMQKCLTKFMNDSETTLR